VARVRPPRDTTSDAPYRLVTIPFSHYCEKARWGLDRLRIPYREDAHPPLFHWTATAPLRRRTVPILVTRVGVFADSTDILEYLDGFAPEGAALYPSDPASRREVVALEEGFDLRLGPATRRWAYGHLLPHRAACLVMLTRGHSAPRQALVSAGFPVFRAMLSRGLGINAAGVARSTERIEEAFKLVDERLADGRRYLTGDRFTAADLTFASLGAPGIVPPQMAEIFLPFDDLPSAMAAEARRLRDRPAGEFILRLYREERGAVGSPGAGR